MSVLSVTLWLASSISSRVLKLMRSRREPSRLERGVNVLSFSLQVLTSSYSRLLLQYSHSNICMPSCSVAPGYIWWSSVPSSARRLQPSDGQNVYDRSAGWHIAHSHIDEYSARRRLQTITQRFLIHPIVSLLRRVVRAAGITLSCRVLVAFSSRSRRVLVAFSSRSRRVLVAFSTRSRRVLCYVMMWCVVMWYCVMLCCVMLCCAGSWDMMCWKQTNEFFECCGMCCIQMWYTCLMYMSYMVLGASCTKYMRRQSIYKVRWITQTR